MEEPELFTTTFTKGEIFEIYSKKKKSIKETYNTLAESLPIEYGSFSTFLKRFTTRVAQLKKNTKRDGHVLQELLKEPFAVPRKRLPKITENTLPAVQKPEPQIIDIHCCTPIVKKEISMLSEKHSEELNRLTCNVQKLEETVSVKKRLVKQKSVQLKRANQTVKRKSIQLTALKVQNNRMRVNQTKRENKKLSEKIEILESRNSELTTKVAKLKKAKHSAMEYYKGVVGRFKDEGDQELEKIKVELKSKQLILDSLEHEKLELEDIVDTLKTELKEVITTKIDKKTFGPSIRKCIYFMIQRSVPVEKCSDVLEYIVQEMCGQTIADLPSAATIRRMVREMGVLSDIQAGQLIASSSNHTLSFDATSIGGSHINEVSIHTADQPITLSIAELSGGKTKNYVQHANETLDTVQNTYNECFNKDLDTRKSITSTLSDRVAVNKCVNKALGESCGRKLHDLKCNVHPLDGLAIKSRKILHAQETVSECHGQNGAAVNVVMAVSKLRYKMGTGDPCGFKTYFQHKSIPLKEFPRYVGNRLHVLFSLAGSVYHHQESLLDYLKDWCKISNSLRSAVNGDLNNPMIIKQIHVLGLFGKMVTGPWMTHIYGNADGKKNLESGEMLKSVVSFINEVKDHPELLLKSDKDAFGKTLKSDKVLISLRNGELDTNLAVQLASGYLDCLNSQLRPYISGELSCPTPQMLEETKHAPPENMHSERVLGMTDHNKRHAPSAGTDFIGAKVKYTVNKTQHWLDKENCNDIIKYSIKKARQESIVFKARKEQVQAEKVLDCKEKMHKRDEKKKRKVERCMKKMVKDGDFENVGEKLSDSGVACSDDKVVVIKRFLQEPATLLDMPFSHVWYDETTGDEKLWSGKIVEILVKPKSVKGVKCDVCYWDESETEDEGCDYTMSYVQLASDYVFGHLEFC